MRGYRVSRSRQQKRFDATLAPSEGALDQGGFIDYDDGNTVFLDGYFDYDQLVRIAVALKAATQVGEDDERERLTDSPGQDDPEAGRDETQAEADRAPAEGDPWDAEDGEGER